MHDGQNVFEPGGPYGCWHADRTADKEINAGHIRPLLIIAIDNDGVNRRFEYVPPGDSYDGAPPGQADLYLRYVEQDVMPFIEQSYRVSRKPAETAIAGSSLGGVVSIYMANETDRFGIIGSMSTAMCWAANYMKHLASRPEKAMRIYHDIGTSESASMAPANYWEVPHALHQVFAKQGYREGANLKFVVGENDDHNEPAWAKRFPAMLNWMFGHR